MTIYVPPIKDILFNLEHVAGYNDLESWDAHSDASLETAAAVLEEAGRIAQDVIAPTNWAGDQDGPIMVDGAVKSPQHAHDAYAQIVEGGWVGITGPEAHGGMNMPEPLGAAISELWHGANVGFSLNMTLTYGAAAALIAHASDALKKTYVPKMLDGSWTGTMNLTEPQAGSDLGALRSKAEPQGDGTYKITGQKIFISYGDHDLTDNIIHLVLARTPDAPAGSKGISLFVVPKFLLDENGTPNAASQVRCVSIEHKMGIHSSPTAVLSFGDEGGATGWLIGEENRGLEYMFVMMNKARFEVGIQAIGVAERAYQKAADYARERVQGRPFDRERGTPIIGHGDVRRMLLSMKSQTEAARGLALFGGTCFDAAHNHPDSDARVRADALSQFLTPIIKGWSTDQATEIASTGIQIHGGLGFIEETGAAPFLRDARILSIYEGTTAIQANDLVFRKLLMDRGATADQLFEAIQSDIDAAKDIPELKHLHVAMTQALACAQSTTNWILDNGDAPAIVAAGAVPYLHLMGNLTGGWMTLKTNLAACTAIAGGTGDTDFLKAKLATGRFYAGHMLSKAGWLAETVTEGARATLEPSDAQI